MSNRLRSITFLSLSVLCLAWLAGCGSSMGSVAGTYELDKEKIKAAAQEEIEKQKDSEDNTGMGGFGAAMVLGMIETMNITMTLNDDGTATMVADMMGQKDTATGTWTLNGKNISITAKPEGEPEETMTGTVDGDTITLKGEHDDDMPFDMVFRKKT